MDIILISTAFITGILALKCNLPPLVGFLLAGFALSLCGFQGSETISSLADLGVTLLLFTIGLKLDVKTLLSKEIWLGATAHNLISTLCFSVILIGIKFLGLGALSNLPIEQMLLLSFALSFSSTVFAVKSLQEKGEMNATYGTIAIGILVMQDIFAVIFLTASTGKIPHWTAVFLFALPLLRPIFYKVLEWVGHGEMLVLSGIFFALVVGAGGFQLVGMKPDLGALILGMLLAGHSKASELSKSLFNLKELFLVCFFLNIGLSEQPTLAGLSLALLFILLLPVKGVLYYLVLNRFKFRVRTSLLSTLSLCNYSEFSLIVAGFAFKMGWIEGDILVAIAIAVSLSFIVAAPLNRYSNVLYQKSAKWLKEQSADSLNRRDKPINPGHAQVLILGMGRIGTGAYDELRARFGKISLGIELRSDAVHSHRNHGRNVILGDTADPDFWERFIFTENIKLILLAMPNHSGNELVLEQLKRRNFKGQIAAIAEYSDQLDMLLDNGVDAAFNIYNEAGIGFARHVCTELNPDFTRR